MSLISFITIFGTSIGSMAHAKGAGELLRVGSDINSSAARGMAWIHRVNTIINAYAVGLAINSTFLGFFTDEVNKFAVKHFQF